MKSKNRIKSTEVKEVNNCKVKIQSIQSFQYNGQWMETGYYVILPDKTKHIFYGYPRISDIKKLLKKVNIKPH